jgi:hypothetical protein
MKITIVTPTGARPEAFKLCERYVARQTLQPHQWIVMDDEMPQTACALGQEYISCSLFKGRMSLLNKIAFLISSGKVTGDGLVFIEDDDWYSENWLQFCSDLLEKFDMIGEGRALYYNVRYHYWIEYGNMRHASLCSTAVRVEQLQKVLALCDTTTNKDPFLDQRIWLDNGGMKCSKMVVSPDAGRFVIGIKGMPGRAGYNVGHEKMAAGAIYDTGLTKLRSLIGSDADAYEQFYNP